MANREYFTNVTTATLDGAIDASQTTLDVDDGSLLPLGGFRLMIGDEILYCISRSTDTLTVVRGIESTTAASHADLVDVDYIITAGALNQLKLDILADNGLPRVPTTGNTYGDEFDDDTFSGWTTVQGGTVVRTTVEKDHFLNNRISTGATGQWTCHMKSTGTLTAGNTIETCVRQWCFANGAPMMGLFMADGVTYGSGTQVGFHWSPHEDCVVVRSIPGYLAQTAFTTKPFDGSLQFRDIHMRLEFLGSNAFSAYTSADGVSWKKDIDNYTPSGLSFTPSYVGIGFTTWNSSFPSMHSFRYFRTNF